MDANEIEVPCDEKPPISENTDPSESTDEQPAAYNKVASSRPTAKLPPMEEIIYNCVSADQQTPISWSDLPNELVELILRWDPGKKNWEKYKNSNFEFFY